MPSTISDRSIIKISGIDAAKFLQNLVTNDVASVLDDESIYAMMLSPQGRFLFDMFVIKTSDGYLMDIFAGTKELLLKKLRMYKINMRVEIENCEGWCVGYERVIATAPRNNVIYKDPRYKNLGYRAILDPSHGVDDENHYLTDKYKYTIPDGGIDLLYDKAMPQEYGAEQLRAISYTKGCYVGQEVISRTKSQGVVRKKIYKVSADFNMSDIPHGTEIKSNGNKIGIFCSGNKDSGIALIREEDLEVGRTDALYLLDHKQVQLAIAPWYNTKSQN